MAERDVAPEELRRRIEMAYMHRTGSETVRGALSWFADQLDVSRITVWRWVDGRRKPGGPVLSMLRTLEEE